MPNGQNLAGVEGIDGVGVNLFDDTIFEKVEGTETSTQFGGFYSGGLKVNQNIKNQMESQPNSRFFNFKQIGDEQYLVTPKLPETGSATVEEYDYSFDENGNVKSFTAKPNKTYNFSIRKNVNYFYKALAKSFIDENGGVDFKKGYDKFIELYGAVDYCYVSPKYLSPDFTFVTASQIKEYKQDIALYKEGLKKIYDFVVENNDMPEEDKEDFKSFCNAEMFRSQGSERMTQPELFNIRFWASLSSTFNDEYITPLNIIGDKEDKRFQGKEYDKLKEAKKRNLKVIEGQIKALSEINPREEKRYINLVSSEYSNTILFTAGILSNNLDRENETNVIVVNVGDPTNNHYKHVSCKNILEHDLSAFEFNINNEKYIVSIDAATNSLAENLIDSKFDNPTYIGLHKAGNKVVLDERAIETEIRELARKIIYDDVKIKEEDLEKAFQDRIQDEKRSIRFNLCLEAVDEKEVERIFEERKVNAERNFSDDLDDYNNEETSKDIKKEIRIELARNIEIDDNKVEDTFNKKFTSHHLTILKAKVKKELLRNTEIDENKVNALFEENKSKYVRIKKRELLSRNAAENINKCYAENMNKKIPTETLDFVNTIQNCIIDRKTSDVTKIKDNISYKLSELAIPEIDSKAMHYETGTKVFDRFIGGGNRTPAEYAAALGKLYIDGAKVSSIYGLDRINDGHELSEKLNSVAEKIKVMLEDSVDFNDYSYLRNKPNFIPPTSHHFMLENKNGKFEPIFCKDNLEPAKMPKVVEKPSSAYKFLHSKESYKKRMEEYQQYLEDCEKYDNYIKSKEKLKLLNDKTKDFADKLNKLDHTDLVRLAEEKKAEIAAMPNGFTGKVRTDEVNINALFAASGTKFLDEIIGCEHKTNPMEYLSELNKLYFSGAKADMALNYDTERLSALNENDLTDELNNIAGKIKNIVKSNLKPDNALQVTIQRENNDQLYAVQYALDNFDSAILENARKEHLKEQIRQYNKNNIKMTEEFNKNNLLNFNKVTRKVSLNEISGNASKSQKPQKVTQAITKTNQINNEIEPVSKGGKK